MAAENGNAHPNIVDLRYGVPISGRSMYVPLAHSAVSSTTPTVSAKTIARRAGIDLVRLATVTSDPPAETGKVLLYTRLIGTTQKLFARFPNGTIFEVGAE